MKKLTLLLIILCSANLSARTTIFIHGTLPPVTRTLVRWFDCPLGLTPAKKQGNKIILGRIPYLLNEASPKEFPLDTFYLYGWSGELCTYARASAARALYHEIKKNNFSGPITIIGHSHGCNVALLLAQIAKEHQDSTLSIDRLILLACPVQKITAHHTKSPVFQKIYSIYSAKDSIQVLDPQGWYHAAQQLKDNNVNVPLFSERIFESTHNLIQACVKIAGKHPSHHSFMYRSFMTNLPSMIASLDRATHNVKSHCSIEVLSCNRGCVIQPHTKQVAA